MAVCVGTQGYLSITFSSFPLEDLPQVEPSVAISVLVRHLFRCFNPSAIRGLLVPKRDRIIEVLAKDSDAFASTAFQE